MTENRQFFVPNSRAKYILYSLCPANAALSVMSVFALLLALFRSDIAAESMTRGMRLCAEVLIPSLFPFMVISNLFVLSGAPTELGRLLRRPMRALLGISGEAGSAILLGILCGFPIGAKTAIGLYEQGKTDKRQLERTLMLCNLPSAAFLISAVGEKMFESKSFGIALYLINIASAVIIGVVSKLLFPIGEKSEKNIDHAPPKNMPSAGGIAAITHSVTDAAVSMLYVCAFAVFFSALVGCIQSVIEPISAAMPKIIKPLIFGAFELTGGMQQSAAISEPRLSMIAAAVISGWSGLSVHCQILSLCRDRAVSFKPYFAAKIITAILNAAILTLLFLIFPM